MVDKAQGGQLLARLKGVRKKLSQELGFLVPAVHIRDNLDLSPTCYRVTLMGSTVCQEEVFVDKELAINPGQVYGQLKGTVTRDPVFKLEAVWIDPSQRDLAQSYGYTVVDASTVVATQMSKVLQDHAHELLGHDDVQQLLNRLAQGCPKLVEDLVPKVLPLSTVVKVLRNLLRENIPIIDMRTIVEVLAENASKSQDPVRLTAQARIALARLITQKISGLEEDLAVISLDSQLERLLLQSVQAMADSGIALEPGLANQMLKAITDVAKRQELNGQPAVLLVPDVLRDFLSRFVRQSMSNIHVLAYSEIPENRQVKIVATVSGNSVAG
jgi:flagellar biosynthesis protein FlhA